MSRTIFIGDVHGCVRELDFLLDKLELVAGDRLMFLGDIVDKGPHSLDAIQLTRAAIQHYSGSACLMGNHEFDALKIRAQGKPGREPWTADASADDWNFLESLPLIARFPDLGAVAVHGGFYPRFFEHYPEGIGEIPASWHKGGGKKMDRLRSVLRTRHVSAEDGSFVEFGKEKPEDPHWSQVYDGREGFAFFGHDPLPGKVRREKNACGLDTGCVFGGTLTAAVVNCSVLTPIFVSEPAHEKYAKLRGEA